MKNDKRISALIESWRKQAFIYEIHERNAKSQNEAAKYSGMKQATLKCVATLESAMNGTDTSTGESK